MANAHEDTCTSSAGNCAGIVLLGGESVRMGRPKALLPFGPEPMSVRIARTVRAVADPLIIVGAVGQTLPEFPFDVIVKRDRHPGRGPLEGLAAGLRAAADHSKIAFVTGCDLPLMTPAFIRRMVELSPGYDVCLPCVGGQREPLAAVYSVDVLPEVESLLSAGDLRPAFLMERARTRYVTSDEISIADPALVSLTNVNHPDEYEAALSKAGFRLSPEDG